MSAYVDFASYEDIHVPGGFVTKTAKERKIQALWYAFGREDVGEETDPLTFAQYAAAEAEAYALGTTYMMRSVMDQYKAFQKLYRAAKTR